MTTVLITGANRGIGLALAEACVERGDIVIASCRHPAAAGDLQALARATDGEVRIVQIDVTDSATIDAAAAEVADIPIDILINNAGVLDHETGSTLDIDFDTWAHAFDVNTMGPLRIVRGFLPNLRAARHPKIATLTSRMGTFASTSGDHLAYRTTKVALNKTMQALASDLRSEGIIVLLFHPGWVRTAMGGSSAPLRPAASARRLLGLIDGADRQMSGHFFDSDGSPVAW